MMQVIAQQGRLLLADGRSFSGVLSGTTPLEDHSLCGEVCLFTGMTGFLEHLTDPCSEGQIVVFTYPLIGNYGVSLKHAFSDRVWAKAVVVSELTVEYSHFEAELSLGSYLHSQQITVLSEVDTRAIARHLQQTKTMVGVISVMDDRAFPTEQESSCLTAGKRECEPLNSASEYDLVNLVASAKEQQLSRLAVIDLGTGKSIAKNLEGCGFTVRLLCKSVKVNEELLAYNPDGIILSDGAGAPVFDASLVDAVYNLTSHFPIFGFGLGMQLIALALGAECYKMPLGHHGNSYPVMVIGEIEVNQDAQLTLDVDDSSEEELMLEEYRSSSISMTRQNHLYCILETSMKRALLQVTHRELHDRTIEGFKHSSLPLWGLQFSPDNSRCSMVELREMADFWQAVEHRAEKVRMTDAAKH